MAGLQSNADHGTDIALPEHLRSTVCAWAEVTYRKYQFGTILTQVYVYRNFRLYHYLFHIHTPVTLYPILDERIIALQFMIKGEMAARIKDAELSLPSRRWGLYYLPAGAAEVHLELGETSSFHIELAHVYLDELAESIADAGTLVRFFEERADRHAMLPMAYLDTKVNDTLNLIMRAEDSPHELPLEFKAHIVTLLNLYRKSIKEATDFELLPDVPYKHLVVDFARQIKADPSRSYSIIKLAQRHQVYYKTLARSFKTLTGVPVKLYVHEQRMLLAFNMAAGSQLPYSEIAAELGYLEPNNLNRAFKLRFGITLSEVRRGT